MSHALIGVIFAFKFCIFRKEIDDNVAEFVDFFKDLGHDNSCDLRLVGKAYLSYALYGIIQGSLMLLSVLLPGFRGALRVFLRGSVVVVVQVGRVGVSGRGSWFRGGKRVQLLGLDKGAR